LRIVIFTCLFLILFFSIVLTHPIFAQSGCPEDYVMVNNECVKAFASPTVVVPVAGAGFPGCEETYMGCWTPLIVSIDVGDTVRWINTDTQPHTTSSGLDLSSPDLSRLFQSDLLMNGDSFSFTFTKEGEYPYYCWVHPWMTGVVIVGDSSSDDDTMLDTIPPTILTPSHIVVDAPDSNGAFVTFSVVVTDNVDKVVTPFCTPNSKSFFHIGTTIVTCSALDSARNIAPQMSFIVTVNPPSIIIPDWIKEAAASWCVDEIDDASFIEGIQYLIDNKDIIVSSTTSGLSGLQSVPSWIKNNACWWSNNQISDQVFASGIQYLIENRIIHV